MTKKLLLLIFLLTIIVSGNTYAQQTMAHDEPDATYRQAMELYNKEKFGAAKELFLHTIAQIKDPRNETRANATLYAAICAAELFNPDAESILASFLKDHPTHTGQRLAWFYMGNLNYRERDFREAVSWFEKLEVSDIDRSRREEFLFKKAYSYFMTRGYQEASRLFSQITNQASAYYSPASYYFGHIAYLTADYHVALQALQQLQHDPQFGPVAPYYITHIYFLQQRFDELLSYAPALLEEASTRRAPEISRMIGEAHFHRADYEQAISYLEGFMQQMRSSASREDNYQLGFAYFITGRFQESVPYLERVTSGDDMLAQNAYFHLAYSYIETGQKRFARNAFLQAHQLDHSEEVAAESLFNYALLSFELSYDPFNEAILSFQKYIEQYPNSPRIDEAYGYLADLYLTTRNYRDALVSLERSPLNTPRLREAYQRVTYYRGVELYNNGDFQGAIDHFRKTQQHQESRTMLASSLYWMGEAHYRLGRYDDAIQTHERFLRTPGAFTLGFYQRAHYSIGYAHFKKKEYGRAIPAFRNFINNASEDPRLLNDATLRIADSYFITTDYQSALNFYNRAINMNVIDTDYGIFQKGLVYGILGDFRQKISTMQGLISNHAQSSFVDDAKYEIANTWLVISDNEQALRFFNQVISQHPNSSYVQSAMLKTGLIHYNENRDEQALEMFKKVVEQYPGTSQAQEALASIRIIYVALDRVDEFVSFSERAGIADISTAQQDSLTYQAAENRYMQGDCNTAVQSFSNYLERFPSGIFATNAHFYRAECFFRTNERERALSGYEFVIERSRTKFLENALLRASSIHFNMGNHETAYQYFSRLAEVAEFRNNIVIAREGQMRSLYQLGRYTEAMEAAQVVLEFEKPKLETEQEAHLIRGMSALAMQNNTIARESLGKAKDLIENQRAAEAMFNLALITFREGNYAEAEEQIFGYVNRVSAYDYWLARLFLLLADVYLEMDNAFQAKHTLQSIIDNYEGEDLRNQAINRMEFILEMERSEDAGAEPDTTNIDRG